MNILNSNFSKKPCIYLFKNKEGEIVYIGKAINGFQSRSSKYRIEHWFMEGLILIGKDSFTQTKKGGVLLSLMSIHLIVHYLNEIKKIDFIYSDDKLFIKNKEKELIKEYTPKYNSTFNPNKKAFWEQYYSRKEILSNLIYFSEEAMNQEFLQFQKDVYNEKRNNS